MKTRRGQNDDRSNQPRGGVGEHGMSGRLWAISGENSPGGFTPNARPNSGLPGKADAARREVGSVHSSNEGRNETGAKGPNLNAGNSGATDEAMAPLMGIKTPLKVQALQRTLYRKAKENARWRAWSLYGDLCRRDVLETALKAVVAKGGAAGIDGMTTAQVKTGAEEFLHALRAQLMDRSDHPGPVKRVWIPKADGKPRLLGIPNVVDRIVQMALLILLQPIFEADFDEGSIRVSAGPSGPAGVGRHPDATPARSDGGRGRRFKRLLRHHRPCGIAPAGGPARERRQHPQLGESLPQSPHRRREGRQEKLWSE